MPDLTINPTLALPSSGTGTANAISQSDAPGRLDENTATNGGRATESPFAAVLKSQVDKKAAPAGTVNRAGAPLLAARADAETEPDDIDLSALFQSMGVSAPTMGAAPAGTFVAANPATRGDEEKPLTGVQDALAPLRSELLAPLPAALSSAPPEASALPVALASIPPESSALPTALPMALPTALPVGLPAAMPATPRLAIDTAGPRKQDSERQTETFPSGVQSRPGEAARNPGKIALDPAIYADAGRRSADPNQPEVAANDFHALLERAVATTTPGASSLVPGSTASPRLNIETPLGQRGWHEEVGQKLTWMVGNNRQQADLVLNPPQLGRVEVSLTMNGDQATAIFTSSNPAVREALENSLHRLREVLADAGVSLGQTQVGSESPNRSWPGNEPDSGRNQGMRYASTIPLPGAEAVTRTGTGAGRGLIDVFA